MKKLLYLLLFIPFTFLGQNTSYVEQDIPLELQEGWNMFGYSCYEPMDVAVAFSPIVDKVIIVKDNSGAVYMTEFGFNGIGNLESNRGYQIKISDQITGFQFCPFIVPLIEGCMGATAFNYNASANSDDGSCIAIIVGCTDQTAFNYDLNANTDDGFCVPVLNGCTDETAFNYDASANTDDGSCVLSEACPYDIYVEYSADAQSYNADLCQTLIVLGCMDESALNFSLLVNTDDGSCQYFGCMNPTAFNYDEAATVDDGSCIFYGCIDSIADNYDSTANTDDGTCIYLGCMDEVADNYDSTANTDDGTCIYLGCMDEMADNYDSTANTDDGTCIYLGCMDEMADNYSPQANQEDGSCIIYGCTLADFPNYNSEATIDDFSCDMNSTDVFGCTDPSYLEYDPIVNQDNGTCSVLIVYGCLDLNACNYSIIANTDDGSCIYLEQYYDCDGNYTPPYIGMQTEGGIVFYVDETGEHGLVAALEDLGQFEWGCYGEYVDGADGQAIGTGYQNTLDIVAGCSQTPIAASEALAYESGGYSDWYLPSRDELKEMYNTVGNGGSEGDIGGFGNNWYWSSSEDNFGSAWLVSFDKGSYYDGKYDTDRVRVIRAF
jgi:hypothetical protein